MKPASAVFLAMSLVFSGCAPQPAYVNPAPTPLLSDREHWEECTQIRDEIISQQRIAEQSGVMATALVEAAVRLNVSNVISGLERRAAIAGCRA